MISCYARVATDGKRMDAKVRRFRTKSYRRTRPKSNGVKLGRKPKLPPQQRDEAIKMRNYGEPMREIARSCNVSCSTISRLAD
jgi:DNA invertase Pin-like site-specific DNA recombinase